MELVLHILYWSFCAFVIIRCLHMLKMQANGYELHQKYREYIFSLKDFELYDKVMDYHNFQQMGIIQYFFDIFYWGLPIKKEYRSFYIDQEYLNETE